MRDMKDLGNEANHEIQPRTLEKAKFVIAFVGSLLRRTYDLLARLPTTATTTPSPARTMRMTTKLFTR